MHLRRRDEFNATVVMLVAIPFDKQLTPFSGSVEIFKSFGLIIRTVLKCLKEWFCIYIMIDSQHPQSDRSALPKAADLQTVLAAKRSLYPILVSSCISFFLFSWTYRYWESGNSIRHSLFWFLSLSKLVLFSMLSLYLLHIKIIF